jgi:hypothetical protein
MYSPITIDKTHPPHRTRWLYGVIGLIASAVASPLWASEQSACYQGLCATLTSAAECPEPGQPTKLQLSGTLADAGNFSITSYELLADANWQLIDNHQIQVLSHAGALKNDGFVIGGSFDETVAIDRDQAQRYTLIHRYRSRAHGYFAVAVDLELAAANTQGGSIQIDIKPGSCPNPLNIGRRGVTSVAIIGTDAFDVRSLDPASIRLEGIAPKRYSYQDVASEIPAKASIYDCTTSTTDGKEDLSLKFLSQQLSTAIAAKLRRQPFDGEIVTLELSASLAGSSAAACGATLTGQDNIQALVKNNR